MSSLSEVGSYFKKVADSYFRTAQVKNRSESLLTPFIALWCSMTTESIDRGY